MSSELTTPWTGALEARADGCTHVAGSFRHEMLFYDRGEHGFVAGTLELTRAALAADTPVLVAVAPARAAALREALGGDAGRVHFADMPLLGRNPARIIPALQDFVREHANGSDGVLGIEEPAWPGRSVAELAECERHEALLNVAFDAGPAWHLLCAYDVERLEEHVIVAAKHSHPLLTWDGASYENEDCACKREPPHPFTGTLPPPLCPPTELRFSSANLVEVRHVVSAWATAQSLTSERTDDLVLAVDELATNSIRHGGGAGTLRCWREEDVLQCEVLDAGWITAPLAGRSRPAPDAYGGRGIWLANQLCDLVQIRSTPAGSVVRVQKHLS